MSPALRQRLLEYARQLVDAKVAEKQLFAGSNVSVMDKMISLQHGYFPRPEELPEIYIRVWAEFTITQVSNPPGGYGTPGTDDYYPYPSTTFSSPIFPVFTLRPGAQAAARQLQLDDMEYRLENATEYSSATSLLYQNSDAPLILAQNLSSWSQWAFPPSAPVYPGFPLTNTALWSPYRIAGPVEFSDSIMSAVVLTINSTATVTLYARTHTYETLDTFEFGGNARLVRLTTRQVGLEELSVSGGGLPRQIAALQDATISPGGSASFSYSPISSVFIHPEDVSLVGFELL
jgi:hypothetical protein